MTFFFEKVLFRGPTPPHQGGGRVLGGMKGREEKSRRIETGSFHTVELCWGDLCYLDSIESP